MSYEKISMADQSVTYHFILELLLHSINTLFNTVFIHFTYCSMDNFHLLKLVTHTLESIYYSFLEFVKCSIHSIIYIHNKYL